VVADPIDCIDQTRVGREIDIGAEPSEGGDDPFEDLGFHAAPGATLEVSGDLFGAVRRNLAIEEGLQGSAHLAATQPSRFDVASGPGHRSPPEVSRRALCSLRNGLALLGEPVQTASASTSTEVATAGIAAFCPELLGRRGADGFVAVAVELSSVTPDRS
jgi:hypothetical protein